jgi:DNA-binding transcriptional LysR family regulator
MTININQLQALDALERERHFSRAAEAIGISQPAVSAQLKKLQQCYEARLIYRRGRQVEFSKLGIELALKARKIVSLLNDFESSLQAAADLRSGHLDIGLSCHHFVMDLLAVYMERYPGIQLKAEIGDSKPLLKKVLAGRVDIAGITGTISDPRLYHYKYSDQNIVLFVAKDHPWAEQDTLSIAELEGEPMVARTRQSMTRQIFSDALQAFAIRPDIVLELDTWETMKEAVASGIGFGIALEDEFGRDDRLAMLTIADAELTASQYFICLEEYRNLGTVQAFLGLVNEARSHRRASGNKGFFDRCNPAQPLRSDLTGSHRNSR